MVEGKTLWAKGVNRNQRCVYVLIHTHRFFLPCIRTYFFYPARNCHYRFPRTNFPSSSPISYLGAQPRPIQCHQTLAFLSLEAYTWHTLWDARRLEQVGNPIRAVYGQFQVMEYVCPASWLLSLTVAPVPHYYAKTPPSSIPWHRSCLRISFELSQVTLPLITSLHMTCRSLLCRSSLWHCSCASPHVGVLSLLLFNVSLLFIAFLWPGFLFLSSCSWVPFGHERMVRSLSLVDSLYATLINWPAGLSESRSDLTEARPRHVLPPRIALVLDFSSARPTNWKTDMFNTGGFMDHLIDHR